MGQTNALIHQQEWRNEGFNPSLRHSCLSVERHALKDYARQPKPEPLGAAQLGLAATADTILGASCPQSGQGAVSTSCLDIFSKVLLHDSQWYSNSGMTHLANLIFGNLYKLCD